MLNKNSFRAAIAAAGLTQKELSRSLGMSENTMSSKVNGQSSFDIGQIDRICVILGIVDDIEKAQIFLSRSSQKRDDESKRFPLEARNCVKGDVAHSVERLE